ncbi:MAG: DUF3592 domain-containing protein [Oligoflexia bacterium]|nr:DUF3592 domain-containing protein [Oligoflexia bacterium]
MLKRLKSLLIVSSLIFTYGGILLLEGPWYLSQKGQMTDGKVIAYEKVSSGNGSKYTYIPKIKFLDQNGKLHIFKGEGSRSKSYSIGDNVPLIYDPRGEVSPMINNFAEMWLPGILSVVMGLLIVFLPFIYLYRKKVVQDELKYNGKKIEADVVRIETDTRVAVGRHHPYVLIAQWHDKQNNVVYTFRSDHVWVDFDPNQFIKQGDKITVYVSPENYEVYWVNIENKLPEDKLAKAA